MVSLRIARRSFTSQGRMYGSAFFAFCMDKTLIHIGYPKCGSSTLQSGLFSGQHPGFVPLPPGQINHRQPYRKAGETAFHDNYNPFQRSFAPFAYDTADGSRWILENLPPHDHNQAVVLSNEDWAGHPFSGGITGDTVARRIHAVMPQARILIIFREQRAMLLSAYAHFLTRSSGLADLDRYLNPKLETQIPWHNPKFYHFHGLVALYQSLFGREKVLALPLEALYSRPMECQSLICEFAGVAAPQAPILAHTSNSRDWTEYTILRKARWINLLGRATPANGHIGFDAQRLRAVLLRLSRIFVTNPSVERQKIKDMKIIEAHLKATDVAEGNRLLNSVIQGQSNVPRSLTDLKTFNYLF